MAVLSEAHVSHVAYVLILYSIAFLLFLFVSMLLHLYASHIWPANASVNIPIANAAPRENGNADRRLRDAEEFELEGLMSDDDQDMPPERKYAPVG